MKSRNLQNRPNDIANQTDDDRELPASFVTGHESKDGSNKGAQLVAVSVRMMREA